MANLIHVVAEPEHVIKEVLRLLKPDGRLVIVSFTADGMSVVEKAKLGVRYLKAFGKPPKGGRKFTLQSLKEFILQYNFNIEESRLLGPEMAKAIFIVARKDAEF